MANFAVTVGVRVVSKEDVTQEILIKLTTKLSTFDGKSSFRTWLYRIAVNHSLNVKISHKKAQNWQNDFVPFCG